MKKLALCIALLVPFVYIYSQDLDYYYLEIKEGYELGEIQKTVNTDQTLTLSMQNTDLAAALNAMPIYTFERAFLNSQNQRLQRVYLISLTLNTSLEIFNSRQEVEFYEKIEMINILTNNVDVAPFTILPNDYEDIFVEGRNTSLDLIRAPLAWTVTRGNPDYTVGVVDGRVDVNLHEDLQGQIIENITIGSLSGYHGPGVVGMINAKTNNGQGIASIAHDSKVAFIGTSGFLNNLTDGLVEIINLKNTIYPNLKVVNCSWASTTNSTYLQEVIYGENGIIENDILIIAAAGNQSVNAYLYPASYDEVVGVTSVGHRVAPTYYHNITKPDGTVFWERSWKDIHEFRPDTNNTTTHTHNDKIDVTAPGHILTTISDHPEATNGYRLVTATSPTTPIVTGVAALVFAANPNLTAAQVKDIIKNTADDIYHIPYNQPYVGLLGTGRVNAYRAVLTAKCMDDPNYIGELDLMVRNSMVDYGYEPDNNTQQVFWNSQDIWVRPNSGESYIDVHENPEYDPINPNYINVRVTNRSCVTSSGNEELKLNWAKADTGLSWPAPWDGSVTVGNNIPLGGEVGTLNIPPLEPGQEVVIEFEWMVPNPDDYIDLNPNPWHFCFLAQIITPDDPMATSPGSGGYVKNNNNVAAKNVTVVDIIPNTPVIGGVLAVSNHFSSSKTYTLEFFPEQDEPGKALYNEAEIGIEMDEVLYQAWSRGNKEKSHLKATSNEKKFIVSDSLARFENIQLNPNEYGTAYITFNFLTKELTGKRNYTYHLAQIDESNNETLSGETFIIRKQPRPGFTANAGDDEEIDRSDSVTLQATNINEDATYNWYDIDGNLIYTGTSITVSPQFTQQYKLEVISDLDGLKDYDELQVTVNPYKIESLVPNPATTSVTVNYIADDASSAYLMVVHQNSGNTSNYIIDTLENSHTIDLNGFASGLYSIILVCDGEIQGSKNLSKQ